MAEILQTIANSIFVNQAVGVGTKAISGKRVTENEWRALFLSGFAALVVYAATQTPDNDDDEGTDYPHLFPDN